MGLGEWLESIIKICGCLLVVLMAIAAVAGALVAFGIMGVR